MNPSTTLPHTLEDLAWAIARDGIEHHEAAVASAVALARSNGLDGALVELVADRAQPAVARERAFGRLGLTPEAPSVAAPRRIAA